MCVGRLRGLGSHSVRGVREEVFFVIEFFTLMRTLRLVPVGCQRIASLSSQWQWTAGACVLLPQNAVVGGFRVQKERGMVASGLDYDGGVVGSSQRRSVGRNFEVADYAHGYGCFAIPAAGLSLSSQRRPYVRVASKKGKKSSESSSDVLLKEREDDVEVEVEGERAPDLKLKGKKKHKGKKKAKESPMNGNAVAMAAAKEEEEEEEENEDEEELRREVALNGAVAQEVEEVHEPQEKGKKKVKGKGKMEQPVVEDIEKDEVQMKQKEKEKKKAKGKDVDSQGTESAATLDVSQEDEELEGFEEIGAESADSEHEFST